MIQKRFINHWQILRNILREVSKTFDSLETSSSFLRAVVLVCHLGAYFLP